MTDIDPAAYRAAAAALGIACRLDCGDIGEVWDILQGLWEDALPHSQLARLLTGLIAMHAEVRPIVMRDAMRAVQLVLLVMAAKADWGPDMLFANEMGAEEHFYGDVIVAWQVEVAG